MKKQLLTFFTIAIFAITANSQDYALQFDEANSQRVKYTTTSGDILDTKLNGATDYTIELWIKPTLADIHNNVLIKRWNQFAVTLYKNDTKRFYFTHYSDGGNVYVNTIDNVINLDQWNHIVIICDSASNSIKLYNNGTDVTLGTQEALSLKADPASSNLYIGYGGSGTYFTGFIDKVRAKNTAETIGSLQTAVTDAAYTSDANTAILYNFTETSGDVTANEADSSNAEFQCGGATCASGETWWATVASTLSLKENNTTKFTLYPNPTKGNTVFIQAKNNETIQKVALFNIIGKSVKINYPNSSNYDLNVKNLSTGIYFVRIHTDGGIGTQKLIIE